MPLQKCCCCVDLRVGSLIIGYLHLVSNFMLFFLSLTLLILSLSIVSNDSTLILTLLGFEILLTAISFIFTIILLYGIHKNEYKHIRPYLIYNLIHLVIHVINFGLSFFFVLTIIDIVSNLFSIVLTAYLLLVIWSYWMHLKAKEIHSQPVVLPAPVDGPVTVVYPETVVKEGQQGV